MKRKPVLPNWKHQSTKAKEKHAESLLGTSDIIIRGFALGLVFALGVVTKAALTGNGLDEWMPVRGNLGSPYVAFIFCVTVLTVLGICYWFRKTAFDLYDEMAYEEMCKALLSAQAGTRVKPPNTHTITHSPDHDFLGI